MTTYGDFFIAGFNPGKEYQKMKCPYCGCQKFYIKDADDEYETYGFDCSSGDACFDADMDESDIPELCDDSHIYCEKCAWNGKYDEIKR